MHCFVFFGYGQCVGRWSQTALQQKPGRFVLKDVQQSFVTLAAVGPAFSQSSRSVGSDFDDPVIVGLTFRRLADAFVRNFRITGKFNVGAALSGR